MESRGLLVLSLLSFSCHSHHCGHLSGPVVTYWCLHCYCSFLVGLCISNLFPPIHPVRTALLVNLPKLLLCCLPLQKKKSLLWLYLIYSDLLSLALPPNWYMISSDFSSLSLSLLVLSFFTCKWKNRSTWFPRSLPVLIFSESMRRIFDTLKSPLRPDGASEKSFWISFTQTNIYWVPTKC